MSYAQGKHAFGFCYRCGFRYPLHELSNQIQNRMPTDMYVCPECYDEDQPQLWVGEIQVDDPRPLQNPRPDPSEQESRALSVTYNTFSAPMQCLSGRVTVSIS